MCQVLCNQSGRSVVRILVTVAAMIVIGTLLQTGFQVGTLGPQGSPVFGGSSFGALNVVKAGTMNFLPIPFWGGDGGGGSGSSSPTVGVDSTTGYVTIPTDPYTGKTIVDYENPVTHEFIPAGTQMPGTAGQLKLYQKAILSDPQLPELNTPTTKDGFYNQKPPTPAAPVTGTQKTP